MSSMAIAPSINSPFTQLPDDLKGDIAHFLSPRELLTVVGRVSRFFKMNSQIWPVMSYGELGKFMPNVTGLKFIGDYHLTTSEEKEIVEQQLLQVFEGRVDKKGLENILSERITSLLNHSSDSKIDKKIKNLHKQILTHLKDGKIDEQKVLQILNQKNFTDQERNLEWALELSDRS